MAIINPETGEIHCKIAYYGPGKAGKSSSMKYLHRLAPPARRGDLRTVATATERHLSFALTPADHPQIQGLAVRFYLYAVPGCVLYEHTRMGVLNGVDGVIFVADSQRDKLQEDIAYLREMVRGLSLQGHKVKEFPVVLQYNKRDIPNALPVAVMDKYLNPPGWPRFETIVGSSDGYLWQWRGIGVAETFDAVAALVLARLAAAEAGH